MRPTEYKDTWPEIAHELCLEQGYTDTQLAQYFKVSLKSIQRYKNKYPEFADAIRSAKDEFDTDIVENALLQRARGVTVTETRTSGGGSDDEAPSAVTVQKELPPDTAACIFWLKNRRPDRWRDKQEIEHEVNKVSIVDLTGENAD